MDLANARGDGKHVLLFAFLVSAVLLRISILVLSTSSLSFGMILWLLVITPSPVHTSEDYKRSPGEIGDATLSGLQSRPVARSTELLSSSRMLEN